MPPTTTRTLNPLPLEHLEPKRFEDLVRQLTYEFRPWRQLEATGRAGLDDGFDVRGFEIVPVGEVIPEEGEEATEAAPTPRSPSANPVQARADDQSEKDAGPLSGDPAREPRRS